MNKNQKRFAQMMTNLGYTRIDKPFWKEKSLKAIWRRVNPPARALLYAGIIIIPAAIAAIMFQR